MEGQANDHIRIPKLQRTLRKRMTDAENALWHLLRGRQLEGCKFRRQHPYGDYILDFVNLELRLVIEVDGGQHVGRLQFRRHDPLLRSAAGVFSPDYWGDFGGRAPPLP